MLDPQSTFTQTRTKTNTKIGMAMAFLVISTLFAVGMSRYSSQSRPGVQFAGNRATQATPTFCLSETSFLPENKGARSLTQALFGVELAQASGHNDPTIENGTVVVESVDAQGQRIPAYHEVKKGSQIVTSFMARTGQEHVGLDPGTYEVISTSLDSRWRGTQMVESRRGTTTRYAVRLTTPVPFSATVPESEPLRAVLPGERDCGSGTVRVIAGHICDRDNRIIPNASGIINVSQHGQAVCHSNAVSGAFEIYDRPNGTYTLQFQNPGLGVFEKEVTLEPKQVNFRMR